MQLQGLVITATLCFCLGMFDCYHDNSSTLRQFSVRVVCVTSRLLSTMFLHVRCCCFSDWQNRHWYHSCRWWWLWSDCRRRHHGALLVPRADPWRAVASFSSCCTQGQYYEEQQCELVHWWELRCYTEGTYILLHNCLLITDICIVQSVDSLWERDKVIKFWAPHTHVEGPLGSTFRLITVMWSGLPPCNHFFLDLCATFPLWKLVE